MVDITNGVDFFTVPEGAYKSIFEKQGYKIVVSESEVVEVDKQSEEITSDELNEKPVSRWTKQELKKYCSEHHISLDGVVRTEDVRERVLEFQEQNLTEE